MRKVDPNRRKNSWSLNWARKETNPRSWMEKKKKSSDLHCVEETGQFFMGNSSASPKKRKKKMMSITWVGKWEKMLFRNYCLFPKGNSTARFAFPLLTLKNSYLHRAVGKNFGWDLWLRLCSTKNTPQKALPSSDGAEIKYQDHQSTMGLSSPLFCLWWVSNKNS